MDWPTPLYLIPYVISSSISLGVALYAWYRRAEVGAKAYALVALSQALWTLGFIFELISPDLEGKIFWDNFQFIGGAGWCLAFLVFTFQYTGLRMSRPALTYTLLGLPGVIFVVLPFTDSLHHLIRPQAWLVTGQPFSGLIYDFTPAMWVLSIYFYGLFALCVALLLLKYVRAHSLYRTQVGLVIAGNSIPLIGTVFTLLGVLQGVYRDITPFTFAIGNLIVVWGLFHYRLFDVVPVARETIFEGMNDAVIVLDARNRVLDLNAAARTIFDLDQRGLIGKTAAQVFAAWPDLVAQYQNVEQAHTEVEIQGRAGRHYIDLRLQGLHDRHGRLTGRFIIVHDITARQAMEEELKVRSAQLERMNQELASANERLQALSRVKDEFVSNVSHELRTPLMNLKSHLDLLTIRPERREAYLATIRREMDRLEHMIEGLLALSRFDQNGGTLDFTVVDLNALVEEYVTDRTFLAEYKGLSLTLDADVKRLPVLADRNMIGEVLGILLTNAINYTPNGGCILVKTCLDRDRDCDRAGFSVADNGVGIPLEEQERLFTRFFRGTAGRASSISGTGLGLALAKEIVDRHQGCMEVESRGIPGRGTTFRVWLPAMAAEDDVIL